MRYHTHKKGWVAAGIVAGIITATAAGGAASAAGEEIIGQGSVTLDFAAVPGSVVVSIWTQNLSTVEAWGTALITDRDSVVYPFGPHHYDAGEVWTDVETLPDYACSDLGSVTGFAFGFSSDQLTAPEWTSGPVTYPDPRITVIGCDAPPPPPPTTIDGDPDDPDVAAVPVVTTEINVLPAAKTDGSLIAGPSQSSPMFGLLFTIGAIVAAAAGSVVAGAIRRR